MKINYTDKLTQDIVDIRTSVFVDEQGFTEEFDEIDNNCEYLVAVEDGKAVGTLRYVRNNDGVTRISRFAILKEYRGRGIGRALIDEIYEICSAQCRLEIVAHAQRSAEGFYAKCGFVPYLHDEEQGVPHVWMRRRVEWQ